MLQKPFKIFTLQWHITDFCEMNCKHCYIFAKKRFETPQKKFLIALENYDKFLKKFDLTGKIYFIGGDPLLHSSFWEILEATKNKKIQIAIMGNYHKLTDSNIKKLKQFKINFYQLSLEGTKTYHEKIRGLGTYRNVIKSIDYLEKNGIKTIINTTLTFDNINEIPQLVKELAKTRLTRFDFVRVVPIGKSITERKKIILPEDFRKFLINLLSVKKQIRKFNNKLEIGQKDNLWKLLYFENNRLKIDLEEKAYGCGMGYRHLTILSNGDILLCRKINFKIGNIFTDDLVTLYQKSPYIRNILENKLIEECIKCPLSKVCKGCPAINFAINKNFKKKDPCCWRSENVLS